MLLSTVLLAVSAIAVTAAAKGEPKAPSSGRLQVPGQEREVTILQLAPLLSPYRKASLPKLGRILNNYRWEEDDAPSRWRLEPSLTYILPWAQAEFSQESQAPAQIDAVIELLQRIAGEAIMQQDGAWINPIDDRLMLAFDKATVARLRSAVDDMKRILAPSVRVHYTLYEGEIRLLQKQRGSTGNAWFEQQLQALSKAGSIRVLHHTSSLARVGDQMQLGEFDRASFVGDVEVEVAHKAGIADPQTQSLSLGHGLGFVVWQIPGSEELSVCGVWTRRTLHDGFRRRAMQVAKTRALELPRIDQSQRLFSLRTASGGFHHLATIREHGRELHAVMYVELLEQRPKRIPTTSDAVLEFVPLNLLDSFALRGEPEEPGQEEEKEEISFGPKFGGAAMPTDVLVASIQNLLGDQADEGLKLWGLGSQLAILGKPELVARAKAIASFYAQPYRRSFRVRIGREVLSTENRAAQWQSLGQPIDIACLGGRYGYALQGYEQPSVTDYDVEIALKSTMSVPEVESFFSGVQAFVSCIPMGKQVQVDVEMLDRALIDMRNVQATAEKSGAVELPLLRETVLEQSLTLKPGTKLVLGAGVTQPIDGVLHRTRFTLELIER
ncbi:MAG: hypothetical protein CSA62_00345 [Planctomycetota bacterium]|nr:MAG: hypothetical protein CSA62_00345 [Planctomycetota bacterium]